MRCATRGLDLWTLCLLLLLLTVVSKGHHGQALRTHDTGTGPQAQLSAPPPPAQHPGCTSTNPSLAQWRPHTFPRVGEPRDELLDCDACFGRQVQLLHFIGVRVIKVCGTHHPILQHSHGGRRQAARAEIGTAAAAAIPSRVAVIHAVLAIAYLLILGIGTWTGILNRAAWVRAHPEWRRSRSREGQRGHGAADGPASGGTQHGTRHQRGRNSSICTVHESKVGIERSGLKARHNRGEVPAAIRGTGAAGGGDAIMNNAVKAPTATAGRQHVDLLEIMAWNCKQWLYLALGRDFPTASALAQDSGKHRPPGVRKGVRVSGMPSKLFMISAMECVVPSWPVTTPSTGVGRDKTPGDQFALPGDHVRKSSPPPLLLAGATASTVMQHSTRNGNEGGTRGGRRSTRCTTAAKACT